MSQARPLTEHEMATNHETWQHIHRVQFYINHLAKRLIDRGHIHDQSKLGFPEVEVFAKHTPFPSHVTYGTEEYREVLQQMQPALDHHYAVNRHHPQYFENGVDDMTLLDLIEMFADWKAASERHKDGDINRSIEVNIERFGLSPQLARIFRNSIAELDT